MAGRPLGSPPGDPTLGGLLAANVAAAAGAFAFGLTLRDLMFVFWLQSVVIGVFHVLRLARLREFSTEGMNLDPRYLEDSNANKWRFTIFFALHYGTFHAGYLAFLANAALNAGRPLGEHAHAILLCAAGFLVHHGLAFRRQVATDLGGKPRLGTLMMMPYFRVIPMHLAILAGSAWTTGWKGMAFFLVLKAGADLVMHVIDRSLSNPGPPLRHRAD